MTNTADDGERVGTGSTTDIDAALADLSAIRIEYQPIAALATGTIVGYEALARWPHLPRLEPQDVFEAATNRETEVGADLDWACRAAALDGALAAGFDQRLALFVNIEPSTPTGIPTSARRVVAAAEAAKLTVVLEVTERALATNTAAVAATVEHGRRMGCLIAIDDVGITPETLTMLPLIAPDIIKLDRETLQRQRPDHTDVVETIRDYTDRSGAVLLAEGIETAPHRRHAHTLGAVLGQGWLYGAAAPLPSTVSNTPTTTLFDVLALARSSTRR